MKNLDGMRYPSIDLLLTKINSKYKLAYTASKVAKLIEENKEKLAITNSVCQKSVGIALEEIINDHVNIKFDE